MSTGDIPSTEVDNLLGRLVAKNGGSITAADLTLITSLQTSFPDLGLLCLGKLVETADAASGGEDPTAIEALYAANVVPFISQLAESSTNLRVHEALANLCATLDGGPGDRARFVTSGGFKALSTVIKQLGDLSSSEGAIPADTRILLTACMLYGKLLVSDTSLAAFFPQPTDVNAIAGLNPLFLLLCHPAATPENAVVALTALRRLATTSPRIGSAIVLGEVTVPAATAASSQRTMSVVDRVEELLLAPVPEIQRLASMLVAMLTSSKAGWYHWSGELHDLEFPGESSMPAAFKLPQRAAGTLDPKSGARLGTLLLLTDHDALATRQSAAMSLAILTQSESAASSLLHVKFSTAEHGAMDTHLFERIVDMFEPGGVRPALEGGDKAKQTPADHPAAPRHAEPGKEGKPDAQLARNAAMLSAHLLAFMDRLYTGERQVEFAKAERADLKGALERVRRLGMGEGVDVYLDKALRVLNKK